MISAIGLRDDARKEESEGLELRSDYGGAPEGFFSSPSVPAWASFPSSVTTIMLLLICLDKEITTHNRLS